MLQFLIPIAAAGLGALGKISAGKAEKKAAYARAQRLEEGSRQRLQETGLQASIDSEEADRLMGTAAVHAAAGGGGGLRGSALDVLGDLERQSLARTRNTIYRGTSEARAMIQDAAASRTEGKSALRSSLISAAGTLLGGFGQAYAARG
jgi:hypothetical protein